MNRFSSLSKTHRGAIICLTASAAALVAFICFYNLGQPFSRADEVMYVRGTQGMIAHKSLLVPFLDDRPIFNKPPMVHWLSAAVISLAGESVITHRLPSALAGCCVFFFVGFITLRCSKSYLAAWLSVVSMGGCSIFLGTNGIRSVGVEAALSLCTVGCLWLLFNACDDVLEGFATHETSPWRQRSQRTKARYAGILCGLSILTKSVAIGILGPILAAYLLIRRYQLGISWRALVQALSPIVGQFLLTATPIPALYYTYLSYAYPDAFRVIISHEIINRISHGYHNRDGVAFYVRLLFFSEKVFPPPFVLLAIVYGTWAGFVKGNKYALFFTIWAITPIAIFTFIPSRLPWYANPSVPPLAILVGISLHDFTAKLSSTLKNRGRILQASLITTWLSIVAASFFSTLSKTYARVTDDSTIPVAELVQALRTHWVESLHTAVTSNVELDRQEVAYIQFLRPQRIALNSIDPNQGEDTTRPMLLIASFRALEELPTLSGWNAYATLQPWRGRREHLVLLIKYPTHKAPPYHFKEFSRTLSGAELATWLRRRPNT